MEGACDMVRWAGVEWGWQMYKGSYNITGPLLLILCLLCWSISMKGFEAMLAFIRLIHSSFSWLDWACMR